MNWTAILANAGTPEAPGYHETVELMRGGTKKAPPPPKKAKPSPRKGKPHKEEKGERKKHVQASLL